MRNEAERLVDQGGIAAPLPPLDEVPVVEEAQVPAFDRDDLIRQIVERLEIGEDEDVPEHLSGKPVGIDFERLLLADMYATLYEFRLWADTYQKSSFGKVMFGGGRRRRRSRKESEGGRDGQGEGQG